MIEDEQRYSSAVESVRTWNTKMMTERKMRLPYLDNTTGLAQANCTLWPSPLLRRPGLKEGQIYSYPERKWRKKKRVVPPASVTPEPVAAAGITNGVVLGETSLEATAGMDPVVNLSKVANGSETTKDKWFTGGLQYEELDDFEDFDEVDDPYGDDSDFEDFGSRKKKKKKDDKKPKKSKNDDVVPHKSKAKQSIEYHVTNTLNMPKAEPVPPSQIPSLPPSNTPSQNPIEPPDSKAADETTPSRKVKVKNPTPNDYCDFCLGDVSFNKKSKVPEEMVSCADCGRSGHPTCLQFTDNMKISVRKYPWQCIECKSCGLCGTSENDDQLLFCDDCDRGYHMYCLTPPLSEPPEGNWSCHLCIQEFHGGVKPDWMG